MTTINFENQRKNSIVFARPSISKYLLSLALPHSVRKFSALTECNIRIGLDTSINNEKKTIEKDNGVLGWVILRLLERSFGQFNQFQSSTLLRQRQTVLKLTKKISHQLMANLP